MHNPVESAHPCLGLFYSQCDEREAHQRLPHPPQTTPYVAESIQGCPEGLPLHLSRGGVRRLPCVLQTMPRVRVSTRAYRGLSRGHRDREEYQQLFHGPSHTSDAVKSMKACLGLSHLR